MNPLLQALIPSSQETPLHEFVKQSPSEALANVRPPPRLETLASGDSPLAPRPVVKPQIQKLRYEHRAMAKMIAANPAISQNDLAEVFGYSPSWISTIIASDAFQAILFEEMEKSEFPAEARAQHKLQIAGILNRSLEILRIKLDKPADEVPDQLAIQSAKLSTTALGMGVRDTKVVTVNETHNHLQVLSENLVGLLRKKQSEALDGQAQLVQESDS